VYGPQGIKELVNTVLKITGGWDSFTIDIVELYPETVSHLEIPVGPTDTVKVIACPMDHRIECFGFVFEESECLPKLNADKARELGVANKHLRDLKAGVDVTLDNGTVVRSSDCLVFSSLAPRKCAVLQDTSDGSAALPYLDNCDLLVHECTYENSQRDKAIEFGHSTPEIASALARKCSARRLALTHFSARFESTDSLGLEARAELVGCDCEVILATDFLEIRF